MKKGIGTENDHGQVTIQEGLFLVQELVLTSNHITIVNVPNELRCNSCSVCTCTQLKCLVLIAQSISHPILSLSVYNYGNLSPIVKGLIILDRNKITPKTENSILPYQPSLFGIAERYRLCSLAIEIFLTQTSWKGLSPHLKILQGYARTTVLADAAHQLLCIAQLSSELQLIFLAFHRPFAPTVWQSEETTKELEQSKTFLLLQQPPIAQKRRDIWSAIVLPLPLTVPSKCKSNVSAEK